MLQYIAQQILLQHQPTEEVQSPNHEVPAGPVPKARAKPDDENVAHGFGRAAPIAAQRDIEIIPEDVYKRQGQAGSGPVL